jgi:transcriptional regulator with XRE-family HTH domain
MSQTNPSSGAGHVGRTLQEFRRELEERDPAFAAESARVASVVALANAVTIGRARRDWTQDQLAAEMGTTKSAISRLESGRHQPGIDTLQRLANVLEMSFVIQPMKLIQSISAIEADDDFAVARLVDPEGLPDVDGADGLMVAVVERDHESAAARE